MKGNNLNGNHDLRGVNTNIISINKKNPNREDENTFEQKEISNTLNNINYPVNSTNTDNMNTVSPDTIQKLKEIANQADILELEIISSISNQKGEKIKINSLGMLEKSKRKAYDGNTFFGFLGEEDDANEANTDNLNNEIDYVIKSKERNNDSKNIGRYFRIRYDLNSMGYLIKDLECGFGTFKKITEKTKLRDCYLINMGISYIVCSFGIDELNLSETSIIIDADKILNIKVYSEIQNAELHFFNPQQFKRIYIGRDASCNIIVDDTLLSRIHCTIEYKEGNGEGWYISDGKAGDDFIEEKPSTNGTWLCLMEETPIKDGMIFKSNQNQFKCKIIKQIKNKKQK